MKLEGFGLFVNDLEKMIAFYRDVLGFAIKEQPSAGNVFLIKDGVLFLMYGRAAFESMVDTPLTYPKALNGTFEIALGVENYHAVDSAYQAVVKSGARILMHPATMPWGQRTFYFADPEGNVLEIGSFQP